MSICQACGHPTSLNDPPVKVDGFTIHAKHLADPNSGFYGTQPDPEGEK